jgi:glycosyltransferase involved in cell wall biosynthesis
MNELASVSVVIPCYCCSSTILRAVKSVYDQTYKPYEVILVDDCSGDETLEVLYLIQSMYGADWVKVIALEGNDGPGTARNIGWDVSDQDFIAFLDSDDAWHPQKIEIQYGWMKINSNAALTGHSCKQIVSDQDSFKSPKYTSKDATFYFVKKTSLLISNRFVTPTVMLKRDIIHRFPSGKYYCEDYHLWLEMSYAGLPCYLLPLDLAYMYKQPAGASGLSSALWKMRVGELGSLSNIYQKGYIGPLTYFALLSYSFAKLVRLYAITSFKKIFLNKFHRFKY